MTLMSRKFHFFLGLLFGYYATYASRYVCLRPASLPDKFIKLWSVIQSENQYSASYRKDNPNTARDLILVGVITADKYIDSRAKAVYDTWANKFPGELLFFVGSNSTYSGDLPVVRLDDVSTEEYPPQRKGFRMLQYMYANYRHRYEWFFRADDDVYIKGERIELLLRSVNSSELWYIGQSGYGRKLGKAKLGLEPEWTYCMGGPGVVLSHAVLTKLGPHIPSCIEDVRSEHEDTEVGRCIHKYMGIGCTSSSQIRDWFYHSYKQQNSSLIGIFGRALTQAFTLHPLKNHPLLYNMHINSIHQKASYLKAKVTRLQREANFMQSFTE